MMHVAMTMIRGFRFLNPFSLISGYLLTSWPSVWRTRIIHVIWWSVVVYCCLYMVGMLIPANLENIRSLAILDLYMATISVLVAMAMSYWLVLIWQTPLANLRGPALSATLLMYLACIYASAIIPVGFNKALVARIAQETAGIEADYDRLSKYNFGNCWKSGEINDETKRLFTNVLPKYGLIGANFDCNTYGGRCLEKTQMCVVFNTSDDREVGVTLLQERILFAKAVQNSVDGQTQTTSPESLRQMTSVISARISLLEDERFLVCFLVAIMFLTLHLTNAQTAPASADRKIGIERLLGGQRRLLRKRMKTFDYYLLVRYPKIWATRFHIFALFNIITYLVLAVVLATSIGIGLYFDVLQYEGAAITTAFVVILLTPPLISSFLQMRTPSGMREKSNHVYFVSSLFASFLPLISLIIGVGLIALSMGNRSEDPLLLLGFAVVLSNTIFLVGNLHYLYIMYGFSYITICVTFCLAIIGLVYLLESYALSMILSCALVVVVALSKRGSRSVLYGMTFTIYTSIMIMSACFLSMVCAAIFLDDNLGNENAEVMAAVLFAILVPHLILITICRRIYTVSYTVYMSPSEN